MTSLSFKQIILKVDASTHKKLIKKEFRFILLILAIWLLVMALDPILEHLVGFSWSEYLFHEASQSRRSGGSVAAGLILGVPIFIIFRFILIRAVHARKVVELLLAEKRIGVEEHARLVKYISKKGSIILLSVLLAVFAIILYLGMT